MYHLEESLVYSIFSNWICKQLQGSNKDFSCCLHFTEPSDCPWTFMATYFHGTYIVVMAVVTFSLSVCEQANLEDYCENSFGNY